MLRRLSVFIFFTTRKKKEHVSRNENRAFLFPVSGVFTYLLRMKKEEKNYRPPRTAFQKGPEQPALVFFSSGGVFFCLAGHWRTLDWVQGRPGAVGLFGPTSTDSWFSSVPELCHRGDPPPLHKGRTPHISRSPRTPHHEKPKKKNLTHIRMKQIKKKVGLVPGE